MKNRRSNAAEERRKVFIAIENLMTTKEARLKGKGARFKDIREYTKLKNVALDATLKWLYRRGLIEGKGKDWYLKGEFPSEFCWQHGRSPYFAGVCIKCLEEGKRNGEANSNK